MRIHHFIILVLVLSISFAAWRLLRFRPDPQVQIVNSSSKLDRLIQQKHIDTSTIFILVQKDSLRLSVLDRDSITVKSYPVVLGGNPVDDKRMQGDQCTPEGTFFVKAAYPHDKWDFFVWINYPTEESWEKHRKAKAEGIIPADASIGGEIGIHGVPLGADYLIDQKTNWTLGCISLKSKDIRELYPYLGVGRKVVIR